MDELDGYWYEREIARRRNRLILLKLLNDARIFVMLPLVLYVSLLALRMYTLNPIVAHYCDPAWVWLELSEDTCSKWRGQYRTTLFWFLVPSLALAAFACAATYSHVHTSAAQSRVDPWMLAARLEFGGGSIRVRGRSTFSSGGLYLIIFAVVLPLAVYSCFLAALMPVLTGAIDHHCDPAWVRLSEEECGNWMEQYKSTSSSLFMVLLGLVVSLYTVWTMQSTY